MTEAVPDRDAPRLRWWREVLYIGAFYVVYSSIRSRISGSTGLAHRNALRVVRLERLLGSFQERRIQHAFLDWHWFISFWNLFYGTFHFVVSIGALVLMYRRMPSRYPLWRNTLAFTTGLALVGFALFPLMPPRLLHEMGFVDTLADPRYAALWSFQSISKVANPYAAMPSLHIGWSLWCACVLVPAFRRPWQRALMAGYPLLTLFAIVVTANHYWLDAVGGAVTLAAGYLLAREVTPRLEAVAVRRRRVRATEESPA